MRPRRSRRGPLTLAVTADRFGADYEGQLAEREWAGGDQASPSPGRRSRGIFYTPAAVVDFIVEQTLGPLLARRTPNQLGRLRILDPACGCGAFLLGAHRWLCRWHAEESGKLPTRSQRRAIAGCLRGIDIDPAAVDLARQALGLEAGIALETLTKNLCVGDALLDHDDWFTGDCDAIVTNPPYINIRRLARSHGPLLANAYRHRYRCATGAFDLYILFLERSAAALRDGGRLGAIVPNKLATLDYARACRELLLGQGRLDEVVDVSHLRVFGDAEVYPYIVVWTKAPAPRDHAIRVMRPSTLAALSPVGRPSPADQAPDGFGRPAYVLQCRQRADRGLMLGEELDVESHVATLPLAELCTIHSGATGFQAAELASRLVEGVDDDPVHSRSACSTLDFIVSGNIDPYSIRLGDVRFIGRQLHRPVLAADDPILTVKKRRLYAGPKIVLAGMSRRLEAALDTRGLALGVQVYALADWTVDPLYLLGLLNSSLLSHLFRQRFAAKRLAGGYFSLSKKQLAQLPIRTLDLRNPPQRRRHDRLLDLVRRRLKSADAKSPAALNLDAQIDVLVLALYRVAAREVARMPAAA